MNCGHWHRIGERCGYCSQITTPARFYLDVEAKPTNTQEQAEAAYLSWVEPNIPDLYAELCVTSVCDTPQVCDKVCDICGKPMADRGLTCPTCRKRKSRGK